MASTAETPLLREWQQVLISPGGTVTPSSVAQWAIVDTAGPPVGITKGHVIPASVDKDFVLVVSERLYVRASYAEGVVNVTPTTVVP